MEQTQQKKRFATLSENDIENKKLKVIAKNTTQCNKLAANTFKEYLKEKNMNENFELLSPEELAEMLQHFYLEARTKDGELYKKKSLESLRYGMNRYLKLPPHSKPFDIISSPEFAVANEAYKAAQCEIKRSGKASVDHYPKIEDSDLVNLYHSVYLSPNTPTGLLNRVQMNIRLYFCRRANENMYSMTKDTFKIKTYPNGKKYICKELDELTKNHKDDNELISGHMPEDTDCGDLCPVRVYEKYILKLNPGTNRLWQYPRECYLTDDDVWFQNKPMGKDTLQKFMTKLSKSVPLSKVYTNHSVRVTGASLLGKYSFSPAQIMSVTGHKSLSALSVYQRVTDEEKMMMGAAIGSITKEKTKSLPYGQAEIKGTATYALEMAPRPSSSALLPIHSNVLPGPSINESVSQAELADLNLDELFCDFESDNHTITNTMNSQTNLSVRKAPVYMNCTFNITINNNK